MAVQTLGYAVFGARDLDSWQRFATNALGMMVSDAPESADGASAIHLRLDMISFYVRSPSGFNIEVGCGGIRVDESVWTTGEITAPSFWGHQWDFGG